MLLSKWGKKGKMPPPAKKTKNEKRKTKQKKGLGQVGYGIGLAGTPVLPYSPYKSHNPTETLLSNYGLPRESQIQEGEVANVIAGPPGFQNTVDLPIEGPCPD